MSLFVAVTLVPVLCSRLLVLPPPADQRSGIGAKLYGLSERMLEAMDDGYKRILHLALAHRPSVIGLSVASLVAAAFIYPKLNTEFSTQTDEGQVQVNIELPRGTRIEVTGPVLDRIEQMVKELVPKPPT
jgi:HAE1 family hydrophobic/amphiphilic exporter-1